MQKLKRWLKLLAFVVLIALALIGVGVAGAPVPPPQNKKEEKIMEINVEMVNEDIDEKSTEFQNKN